MIPAEGEMLMPESLAWHRLVGVVQQLSTARDFSNILQIAQSAARELTCADGATFMLRDGNDCLYADEDAIAPLWKGRRFPIDHCIGGWVMRHCKSVTIADVYSDPRIKADDYRTTFVKSLAMVPIGAGEPLGAIGVYWGVSIHPTKLQMKLLRALAESVSHSIANLELLNSLERTARDEARRFAAASKEMEAFSYSVSHDLRSPLAALKGYAELLAEDYSSKLDTEAAAIIGSISQCVGRMGSLIDSLLSLGRLTNAELKVQAMDLRPFVQETISHLVAASPDRRIQLKMADDLVAEGDPSLLRLVVENLLSNAWKYTCRCQTALIEVGKIPGSPAVFFVRDNGVGFEPSQAERLFLPFQRLHSERDFPGIGIGLATVQRIVARHGGRIWADSAPGQGTTLCFTLPNSAAQTPLRLAA
jgi:signal transduction histidine kinase